MLIEVLFWLVCLVAAGGGAVLVAMQKTMHRAMQFAWVGIIVGVIVALVVPNRWVRGIFAAAAFACAGTLAVTARQFQAQRRGSSFWFGLCRVWNLAFMSDEAYVAKYRVGDGQPPMETATADPGSF